MLLLERPVRSFYCILKFSRFFFSLLRPQRLACCWMLCSKIKLVPTGCDAVLEEDKDIASPKSIAREEKAEEQMSIMYFSTLYTRNDIFYTCLWIIIFWGTKTTTRRRRRSLRQGLINSTAATLLEGGFCGGGDDYLNIPRHSQHSS